ncbi:hypothetical protein [Streptomyces phaeochromogenes]|uniref:hypothetical protein n=1 Tax=Streptomyces phaeochromogenes TaxID=1923 RepID=UPI002DD8C3A9|nr:hypothetical protein [Streptomyces phaeochromogenes]WRZ31091.1 hypothetical protein OG931_26775 [Streptomyces phaeochromogenes]
MAAVIAAVAAVVGGLLTAFATRSVERLRLRASLLEKAQERRLAGIEDFMLATSLWVDWLTYIQERGWEGKQEELNRRVRARDEAYRRLLLLASDELYRWLKDTYLPAEYLVRQTYVRQLRSGLEVDEQALAARRAFNSLLRDDLVDKVRPDIHKLRDPLA